MAAAQKSSTGSEKDRMDGKKSNDLNEVAALDSSTTREKDAREISGDFMEESHACGGAGSSRGGTSLTFRPSTPKRISFHPQLEDVNVLEERGPHSPSSKVASALSPGIIKNSFIGSASPSSSSPPPPSVLRRLKYENAKSLKQPSSKIGIRTTTGRERDNIDDDGEAMVHYWETLGSCRLQCPDIGFSWCAGDDVLAQNMSEPRQPEIVGCSQALGRVYYKSFRYRGKVFKVGDFVRETKNGQLSNFFRIVGAFQATKSFVGVWNGPGQEIQKRGHPYILGVFLYRKSDLPRSVEGTFRRVPTKRGAASDTSDGETDEEGYGFTSCSENEGQSTVVIARRKRRKTGCGGAGFVGDVVQKSMNTEKEEVVLGAASGAERNWARDHIESLPIWLGGLDQDLSRVDVQVLSGKRVEHQGEEHVTDSFCCRQALTRDHKRKSRASRKKPLLSTGLTDSQYELLTSNDAAALVTNHISDTWDDRLQPTQVQFIREDCEEREQAITESEDVSCHYSCSSDDSDGFDKESRLYLNKRNGSLENVEKVEVHEVPKSPGPAERPPQLFVLRSSSKWQSKGKPKHSQGKNSRVPVPSNSSTHRYIVERKIRGAQVAARIACILKGRDMSYDIDVSDAGPKPIALLFAVNKSNCTRMANLLIKEGIASEVADEDLEGLVERLSSGESRVVCTTEALPFGGVAPTFSFVFHIHMPSSLRTYVQETCSCNKGKQSPLCIIFFRPQDRLIVEKTLRGDSPRRRTLPVKAGEVGHELDEVADYCIMGDACRLSFLTSHVSPPSEDCGRCDNCERKLGDRRAVLVPELDATASTDRQEYLKTVEINHIALKMLQSFNVAKRANGIKLSELNQLMLKVLRESKKGSDAVRARLPEIFFLEKNEFQFSIRSDFLHLLVDAKVAHFVGHHNKKIVINESLSSFIGKVRAGEVTVEIRNVRVFRPSAAHPVQACSHKNEKFNLTGMEITNANGIVESVLSAGKPSLGDNESSRKSTEQSTDLQGKDFFSSELYSPSRGDSGNSAKLSDAQQIFLRVAEGASCPWLSMPRETVGWVPSLPFLVQFEIWRLFNEKKLTTGVLCNGIKQFLHSISSTGCDRHTACDFIHKQSGIDASTYLYKNVTKAASLAGLPVDEWSGAKAFGCGSALYFHCRLGDNGKDKVILSPPRQANDCRLFRKFGSHRFLHVSIPKTTSPTRASCLIEKNHPLWICGRKYGYLWCDSATSPQLHIFFAEHGVGICKEQELSAEEVLQWCFPKEFNSGVSLSEKLSRLMMSARNSTPSGHLCPNCLELVKDISGEDMSQAMTSGCGLLSRDALDYIWRAHKLYETKRRSMMSSETEESNSSSELIASSKRYIEYDSDPSDESGQEESCPHTSFEGQIGGMSGTWVLDDSLGEGIKVVCRESQQAYSLPMRSLATLSEQCKKFGVELKDCRFDHLYDTVEVCCWDGRPEQGLLDLRLIQILEHRGVSFDFFKKCCDDAMNMVEKRIQNSSGRHDPTNKKHQARESTAQSGGSCDGAYHIKNVEANADISTKKEVGLMQRQGSYPLKRCRYLRLIPDHTQLLEEGEAFVAAGFPGSTNCDIRNIEKSEHLLAVRRSPAFFSSDLLKLKIVSRKELRIRARLALATSESGSASKSKSCGIPSKQEGKDGGQSSQSIARSIYDKRLDDPYEFFQNLATGLVLSTKGCRSFACDFRCVKAWVCWDLRLTQQVHNHEGVEPPPDVRESPMVHMLSHDSELLTRFNHARHFRGHHDHLCDLIELLYTVSDVYGVDSDEANAVAKEAFLQSHCPYNKRQLPHKYFQKFGGDGSDLKQPHWKGDSGNRPQYRSTRALGLLWDHMEERIQTLKRAMGTDDSVSLHPTSRKK